MRYISTLIFFFLTVKLTAWVFHVLAFDIGEREGVIPPDFYWGFSFDIGHQFALGGWGLCYLIFIVIFLLVKWVKKPIFRGLW